VSDAVALMALDALKENWLLLFMIKKVCEKLLMLSLKTRSGVLLKFGPVNCY
jgi:hypothetical protein